MRIIVCTKRDLIGAVVLNDLLPKLAGHSLLVLLSDKTRPAEVTVPELGEIKFLERDLPLDMVFPLVDAVGGEGGRMATFNGLARRHGVPVKVVETIATPEAEQLVRDFAPDLIVSIRFSHIFRRNIIDIPPLGIFNIHPGALPRFAGLFAAFRGLLKGEARIGCTLHRVDEGIDTGPIVGIGWLPVRRDRSLLWHVVNTYGPGIDEFMTMLATIEAGGTVVETPQDLGQRVYRSMPDAATFAAFKAAGWQLYDPQTYQELLGRFLPPQAGGTRDPRGRPCFFERA